MDNIVVRTDLAVEANEEAMNEIGRASCRERV